MYYDELYHHGILGMHWGIRRYQNKDGSLTAEGIKRYRTDLKFQKKYNKYVAKQNEKAQKKQEKEDEKLKKKLENEELKRTNELKSKKISDLTEEELNERIRRANLEKLATDLEKQYQQNVNALNDMAIGPAKKFVMNVGGRFLENAASSIGNAAIKELTDTLFPDKSGKAALAKEINNLQMTKRELGLDIKKQQNTILFNSYNEKMDKKAAEVEAARNAALAAINAQKQSLNTPVQNIQTQNTPSTSVNTSPQPATSTSTQTMSASSVNSGKTVVSNISNQNTPVSSMSSTSVSTGKNWMSGAWSSSSSGIKNLGNYNDWYTTPNKQKLGNYDEWSSQFTRIKHSAINCQKTMNI